MKTQSNSDTALKTIENPSVEAYRRYLKGQESDYYVVVKKESEEARRKLQELARTLDLKKITGATTPRFSHSKGIFENRCEPYNRDSRIR